MGIEVNVRDQTLSIPEGKMAEIVKECEMFAKKSTFDKRELQSLIGRLLYVSKIIKPARAFLNRMIETLRAIPEGRRLTVNRDFQRDLQWFRQFIRVFNDTCSCSNWEGSVDIELYTDASLLGLGGVMEGHFYSVWLPDSYIEQGRIMVNEMVNILVALWAWGHTQLHDKRLTIWCDNNAVVEVLTRHRTRDKTIAAILREILMVQANCNIHMDVNHVRGEQNPIADSLSRVHFDKCYNCIAFLQDKGYKQTLIKHEDFWLNTNHL